MTGRHFVNPQPTDDPTHWRVPVEPRMLTAAGAVQGGTAFATVIETMETVVDRPLVWASAQFLRHAGPGAIFDIEVTVELDGHNTTQARACARVGGVDVLTVAGALGARSFDTRGVWARPPDPRPSPTTGPALVPSTGDGYITDYLDVRLAVGRTLAQLDGSPGGGRWAAWCRLSDHVGPHSAADLAVFGDLVVLAFGDAVGRPCTGNSLDNSLRVIDRASSDWILLDVAVSAVEHGFGHAHAHLWTEEGRLLAIADQTLVLREIGPDGHSRRRGRRIVGDAPGDD